MKKRVACFAVLFVGLSCLLGEAASVGAPGFGPGRGRYIFGLEYVSVKGRALSDEKFEANPVDAEAKHFISRVNYGLTDRLSLSAGLGSSDLTLYGTQLYPHSGDLGWGLGFDVVLYEDLKMGISLITGAQYYTYAPAEADGRTFDWQEWDASMRLLIMNYVADPRELIQPFALTHATFYSGLRYSDVIVDWTRGAESGRLEAEDKFGYFAGIDFVFNDNYIFTVEGRFRDETAYTAGIGFKF